MGTCLLCGMPVQDTTVGPAYHDCPGARPAPVSQTPHCCPVCQGSGLVSRPPRVAGDVEVWSANGTAAYGCRACSGTGIVWGPAAPLPDVVGVTVEPAP